MEAALDILAPVIGRHVHAAARSPADAWVHLSAELRALTSGDASSDELQAALSHWPRLLEALTPELSAPSAHVAELDVVYWLGCVLGFACLVTRPLTGAPLEAARAAIRALVAKAHASEADPKSPLYNRCIRALAPDEHRWLPRDAARKELKQLCGALASALRVGGAELRCVAAEGLRQLQRQHPAKMRAAVGSWLAAAVDAALRDAGEARTILVSVIEVQPPAGVKPALCEEVLTTLFGASATPTEAGAVLVATPGAAPCVDEEVLRLWGAVVGAVGPALVRGHKERLNALLLLPSGAFAATAPSVRAATFRAWERLAAAWASALTAPGFDAGTADRRISLLLTPLKELDWSATDAEAAATHEAAADCACTLVRMLGAADLDRASRQAADEEKETPIMKLACSLAGHHNRQVRLRALRAVAQMASARPAVVGEWLCGRFTRESRLHLIGGALRDALHAEAKFLDANGAVGEHGEAVVAALCECWVSVVASLPSAATSAVASQVAKELMSASGLVASFDGAPAVTRLGPALAKVCVNPERQTARTVERMLGRQLTAAATALGEPPVLTVLGLLCAPSGDGGAADSGIGSLAASLAAAGLLAAARRAPPPPRAATAARRRRRRRRNRSRRRPRRTARRRPSRRGRALALLKPAAELLQKVVALAHAQPDARGGSLLHDDAEARLHDVLRALSLLAAARGATEGDGVEAGSKRKRGEVEE